MMNFLVDKFNLAIKCLFWGFEWNYKIIYVRVILKTYAVFIKEWVMITKQIGKIDVALLSFLAIKLKCRK